jgi:hypothetical protein
MKLCLSILLAKPTAGLLALAVAFVGGRFAASSSSPEPVGFQNASELRDFAASRGFVIHSGNSIDKIWDNYYVADHPVTLDDLELVATRRDCGLTPAWRGILWVSQINGDITSLNPEAIGGKWRIWGKVLVAGDVELMDRIEELSRSK